MKKDYMKAGRQVREENIRKSLVGRGKKDKGKHMKQVFGIAYNTNKNQVHIFT